jgi:transcriptional regulator with XRE-family HTH domain
MTMIMGVAERSHLQESDRPQTHACKSKQLAVRSQKVNESKHGDLGEFIRGQRERANLSLRRLAENAGISNPYLSQIERGIRRPSAEILKNLARALEISSNSLYSRAGLIDEEMPPVSVFEAIDSDEKLTGEHKRVLLDMYRALIRSNGTVSDEE